MSVNKVILVGNVGKDPETRYVQENVAVCNFSLATSEVYRNRDGERVTQTEWHNIVLWRGLAQVAEKYVKKGSQLYIEGKIRTRSYDDKDGNKRYITEILGDNMQMLGRKQEEDSGAYPGQSAPAQSGGQGQENTAQAGGQGQAPASPQGQDSTAQGTNTDTGSFPGNGDQGDDLPF